jgi:hypothetical protein
MTFSRIRRWFSSMAFVLCTALMAASCTKPEPTPQKFGGTWTMSLGDRIFLVLELTENGDKIGGNLTHPEHFQIDGAGSLFSKISPNVVSETVTSTSVKEDLLRFSTANSKDPSDITNYELAITGKDQASLKIVDVPFEAWPIARVPSGKNAAVFTGWDASKFYPDSESAVSSPEMQKIYEEDQKPRQNPAELTPERWAVIALGDSERRKQTAKLLADGQLHSGEDFTRAAYVFQHGNTPDDYLLAHTLAMVAVAKGDRTALWIGSATLDRYLHSIGKPQIYGTQFKAGPDASQEPFDRKLISDSLRRELGVPAIAAQKDQQKFFLEQSKPAPGKP